MSRALRPQYFTQKSFPTSTSTSGWARESALSLVLATLAATLSSTPLLAASSAAVRAVPAKGQGAQLHPQGVEPIDSSWGEFAQLLEHYKEGRAEPVLVAACGFIDRWAKSPLVDSARILAAGCARQLERPEQAYELLSQVEEEGLRLRLLDLRMELLYQLGRFEQAVELASTSPLRRLSSEQRDRCEYLQAQCLYRSLGLLPEQAVKRPLQLDPQQRLRLEQALSLYTSSKALGYRATIGRAECAHLLGIKELAYKGYLEASEQVEGAEKARALYLAAVVLHEPQRSRELAWRAAKLELDNPWCAASSLLWVQLSLEPSEAAQLLADSELFQQALRANAGEALWAKAQACQLLGRLAEQIETLEQLLELSFQGACEPQLTVQALGQHTGLMVQLKRSSDLELWSERYGRAVARDEAYFESSFLLGRVYEEQGQPQDALRAYSRILLQQPNSPRATESLLHRGRIEAKLGLWQQAWSSLHLHLRQQGAQLDLAWPLYLEATHQLCLDSAPLSLERYERLLEELATQPASLEQKQKWVCEETARLDRSQQWSLLQSFTWSLYDHHRELLSAMSRLLMHASAVHLGADPHPYFQAAHELVERSDNPAPLQLAYADQLEELMQRRRDLLPQLRFEQMRTLDQLSSYAQLDEHHLSRLFDLLLEQLKVVKTPEPWQDYFPDAIYDPAHTAFVSPGLDPATQLLVDKLLHLAQSLKEKPPLPVMTRLYWLKGDWAACQRAASEPRSVGYRYAASERLGDLPSVWQAGSELLRQMQQAPLQLRLSFQLAMARSLAQGEPWHPRALELLAEIDREREVACEPLHLEAAIEAAELAAVGKKGRDYSLLYRKLMAVKQRYMEPGSYQDQMRKEKSALYEGYTALIDAKLLHAEGMRDLATSPLARDQLASAKRLYQLLRGPRYGVSDYLVREASKGFEEIELQR